MKIKTNELTGVALDWAVTKCEGFDHEVTSGDEWGLWGWATDWAQGGPIIERERIAIDWSEGNEWCASCESNPTRIFSAATPLIAAMRCYVASKLGDDVDVPEELI
jgi:hypothetical protein